MLPLRLKDIAQKIGMHESTISRCTNKKYIQTPRGVYEMKYFFSSEIKTKFGAMASSTSVKSLLKDIIAKENPKSPLSDIQIADSLSKMDSKLLEELLLNIENLYQYHHQMREKFSKMNISEYIESENIVLDLKSKSKKIFLNLLL